MSSKPLPSSNFTARLASTYDHSEENLSYFKDTHWCQAIINSSATTPVATPSLEPKQTTEDALFATIIQGNNVRNRETIYSCISFRRSHSNGDLGAKTSNKGTNAKTGAPGGVQGTAVKCVEERYDEILTMLRVGNGLDGHEGILHGGFIAMILDEVMGMAGGLYADKSTFTASLKLDYRNPISTPGIILVRGVVEKKEGRKRWIKGSIEDGQGLVFVEAEGLWIEFREQKL